MDLPDKTGGIPPKKKIVPVVRGAVPVNRPATRRFLDYIFQESPKSLGSKVFVDVIIPRFKAGIEEAGVSLLSGMLWGDSSNRPLPGIMRGIGMRGGPTPYSTISGANASMMQARQALPVSASTGNYQDLVLPTMQEAETLLVQMYELLNQYRVVTVADLYELAAWTPAISDNSYGWTSLEGSRISKSRDGFCLELPRPSLI